MRVGSVAFAHETIKHIWKWADSMTNSLRCEPRGHLSKMPVLLSEPLYRYQWACVAFDLSFKSWGFYTQRKKHLREATGLHAVYRYARNEDKTNTKEAVTPCVPPVPNPSTPESVPATPSSELRSKCKRMAHRSAQREGWPPQSLLCPWTKVLLRG